MPTVLEIARVERDGCPELIISGRLDSYWARHLSEAVSELMREGIHRARLNLSKTSYISSAGIQVLLAAFQQFEAVSGRLLVVEPSPPVRQILELAGLGAMMFEKPAQEQPEREPRVWTDAETGCMFELYPCWSGNGLRCRASGNPEALIAAGFNHTNCEMISVPREVTALGLGAFGEAFEDCRERFGEFVAVAGCAACQPTDETGYPDYLLSTASLAPRVAALYSLSCRGTFGQLLRFETQLRSGPVGLGAVAAACMESCKAPVASIVIIAESSGVLGASLKHSPARPHETLFHHPEVRDWLSFSPVRSFTRSVVAAVGVVAQSPCPQALRGLLRPMRRGSSLFAHFHAAVFGYRPLRKGYIELEPAIARLFDGGGLLAVLHLLADDRPDSGAAETEFTRGGCWIGAISEIVTAGDMI